MNDDPMLITKLEKFLMSVTYTHEQKDTLMRIYSIKGGLPSSLYEAALKPHLLNRQSSPDNIVDTLAFIVLSESNDPAYMQALIKDLANLQLT